ncbi:LacI family DNA-binding transcriptional regulator [Pseudonocardia sp. GCM10023141]|uniref:LacI family DNA-binding transcriptional regulator n=1 Tax=Pseudonocardia sp. GCM10023141 TaxID=3252653 RepID=UPI0036079B69
MTTATPVTLIAVAKAAGVSKTTASDALRRSGRVSEATRVLVAETAARLGYSPNRAAQSLRSATTATIGLHVPEIVTRSEYYMSFVFGVVDEATRHEHDVTLLTARRASGLRVDGLVLADPLAADPVVHALMDAAVPVVTCERFLGDARAAGIVASDHAAVLTVLLDQLHAAGARRPALIASTALGDWGASLQRAFREWCGRTGVRVLQREPAFGSAPAATADCVRALLPADPDLDALICAPDGSAAAALPALRDAGRVVGTDVLVASCVDGPALLLTDPPVTAIDLHPREAGAACARLLFDLLDGSAAAGTVRELEIGVHRRRSTTPG